MRRVVTIIALLGLAAGAPAADWPQFLGPTRNALSTEVVLPWQSPPKASWRVPVGEGHSSPVVAGGRIFLHTKVAGEEAECVQAFDASTGAEVWAKTYARPAFTSPFGLGPRATPSVAGDTLVTFGSTGVLSAWAVADGALKWRADTQKLFSPPALTFGVSASPIVVGDKILINVGAKGASIVAFALKDGAVAWKAGNDPASYASPARLDTATAKQVVFLTGASLIGLNPETGDVYWTRPFKDLLNESSTTPVRVGDVLVGSSVTAGSIGLTLAEAEGKPTVAPKWKQPLLTSYFTTPIPFGEGNLLMVTGQLLPPPRATLRLVDAATGKERWSKKGVGTYHAALIGTGDGKALVLEESGDLVLIAPDPAAYREAARAPKLCGQTWAHPALANGAFVVRDARQLMSYPLPTSPR